MQEIYEENTSILRNIPKEQCNQQTKYEEDKNFIHQPVAQLTRRDSLNLTLKILSALVVIFIFSFATSFLKKYQIYSSENNIFTINPTICEDGLFLLRNSCNQTCSNGLIPDISLNMCIPKSIQRSQINITKSSDNNTVVIAISSIDFNSLVKSNRNYQKSGILFFNDFQNGDYSEILNSLSEGYLARFLQSLNGIIITFSGADAFYIYNEEYITEYIKNIHKIYPTVKDWYLCGFGFSGGFSALKYALQSPGLFNASFLLDPVESLRQISDQSWSYLSKKPSESIDLRDTLNKNVPLVNSLKLFMFENTYYKMDKITVLKKCLSSQNSTNIFTFFENDFQSSKTKAKHLEITLMQFIEQYLSTLKKSNIDEDFS